ncbi:hypothetical protein Tco_0999032 [Tanacetum coccineum]
MEASPLAPRALLFSTPPSSPHTYSNSFDDLPSRSSNPPPPPLDQINSQTLSHTTLIDFEPSFPPINLSWRGLSQNIEIALHNVQNSLLPSITTISSQMPHLPSSLHHTGEWE